MYAQYQIVTKYIFNLYNLVQTQPYPYRLWPLCIFYAERGKIPSPAGFCGDPDQTIYNKTGSSAMDKTGP